MHTSINTKKFYYYNKDALKIIFLPKYSPFMNPQEQIWCYLKAQLYKPSTRSSKSELIGYTYSIFSRLNLNKKIISSLADGRKYLV